MTPFPHILLVATQILALTLPPFSHRATVFVIFIVLFAIWSYYDLLNVEPTDTDLHSPKKHIPIDILLPLLSQWPWYLSTIEKLLFSLPERDYWRLHRQPAEALTLSWPAKFKWAVALYCSPRGVGWNFRVRGVPRYTGPKSRPGFILNQLGWLTVCAVGIDAMGFYTREYYFAGREGGRAGVTSYSSNWARSAVNALHGLFTPYFGLNIAYGQIAILCVGLGLDDPEVGPFETRNRPRPFSFFPDQGPIIMIIILSHVLCFQFQSYTYLLTVMVIITELASTLRPHPRCHHRPSSLEYVVASVRKENV